MVSNVQRFFYPALFWVTIIVAGHWFAHNYHAILVERFSLLLSLLSQSFLLFILIATAAFLLRRQNNSLSRYLMIALWAIIIVCAHNLVFIDGMTREELLRVLQLEQGYASLFWITILYALVLAIPFMPGLELGLILMLLFGMEGVVAAYIATIIGLSLAFCAGLYVANGRHQTALSQQWFNWQKVEAFMGRAGSSLVMTYRYPILALLINLPGNMVLGGGGGISFISGLSGHYTVRGFILTVSLAVLPLPVLILLGIVSVESINLTF